MTETGDEESHEERTSPADWATSYGSWGMVTPLVGRDGDLQAVAETLGAGRSVVVTGGAGVGKSALLRTTGQQHGAAGWEAHRVVGSLAARDMHLAAVARLVPLDGSQRPHELIASTVAHLRRRAAEGPQLLVVDDAHLLDAGSAVLLQEVVVDGAVPVLCAVRHGEDCPDPVVRLWKDDHARHLELGPLPRPAAAALLTTLLDGPVGPNLEAELWRLTRGNPLFLTEFVLALRDDELQSDDGVWVATRKLPGSRRLADVVDLRLRNLDPADREALELLSVGEPLPLQVAVDLLGQNRMERLESLQLATVDAEVGQFRPSHPMHGEVLRQVMPPTRRSALASRIADALVATDPEDPELLVRTAATLLDAGRPPPVDLALRSAEAARAIGDLRLAARIARHALDAHPVAGGLILGRVLRLLERGEDAEAALVAAAAHAETEAEVAEVALARARNCFWELDDLPRGRAIVDDALADVTDPTWRQALEGELSLQALRFGEDALAAAEEDDQDVPEPRPMLQSILVESLRKALALDGDGLDELLDRGFELAARLPDEQLATQQLHITWMQRMLYEDVEQARERAERLPRTQTPMRGVWSMNAAIFDILAGQLEAATVAAAEARALLEQVDPFGNLPMARAIHALALVRSGEGEQAAADEPFLTADSTRREPRVQVWADRALGWLHQFRGDTGSAVQRIVEGGTRAVGTSNIGWGCDLLHDAVRLGRPREVLDLLEEHAAGTRFTIAELHARHARALADGDTDALGEVGSGLARAGSPLQAAEAWAQVAAHHRDAGDDPAAARAATCAQLLADGCTGVPTPPLTGVDDLGVSARELEVIDLALAGDSNRAIADALVLSQRTVENHLSRVYGRLEVAGRAGLAALARDAGAHDLPGAA